jgi:hypothetical protein
MTMTLSPPIRIFAFVGVLAAVGLAAFFVVAGRSAGEGDGVATPAATAPAKAAPAAKTPATPATRTKPATPRPARAVAALPPSGFPRPVHRKLRANRVAIVVVYTPGAAVDSVVRAEARAAARTSKTAIVHVSALSERLVTPLVAKTGVLPNPAVLVVKRSGDVVATLGVTDRGTIAQAVAQARR